MDKNFIILEDKLTRDDLESLERILIRRWKQLYPEWEIVILSLPREDREQRFRILSHLMETYTSQAYEQYCEACRQERCADIEDSAFS